MVKLILKKTPTEVLERYEFDVSGWGVVRIILEELAKLAIGTLTKRPHVLHKRIQQRLLKVPPEPPEAILQVVVTCAGRRASVHRGDSASHVLAGDIVYLGDLLGVARKPKITVSTHPVTT